jgi:hypothetical protein
MGGVPGASAGGGAGGTEGRGRRGGTEARTAAAAAALPFRSGYDMIGRRRS